MTAIDSTDPAAADGAQDRKAPRSSWLALYVVCVGVLMIVLDQSIVNIAGIHRSGVACDGRRSEFEKSSPE